MKYHNIIVQCIISRMRKKFGAKACLSERREGGQPDSQLRPDIVTTEDNQIFDVVISKDKNRAFSEKVKKYEKSSFLTKVVPIAMDYYFELHPMSYNRLTKYMNGDVLKQTLAFWQSRMMCDMLACYNLGTE